MEIVHLTGYFNEKVAYQENLLTRGQIELGHSVSVICSNLLIEIQSTRGKRVLKPGIYDYDDLKVYRLKYLIEIKKNSLVLFFRTIRCLKSIKPDYIFIHDKGFYVLSALLYKLIYNKNILLRMDFHSDFTNSMNSRFGKYYHFLFKIIFKCFGFAFDKYYFIAPEMGSFIHKVYGLPKAKTELLRLPGDGSHVAHMSKEECLQKWGLNSNKINLVHSGKMPEGKKTIELIEAVKNLNVHLVICGSITGENSESLKQLIEETSNVEFKGWLNPNQLRELIKASDAVVQPGTNSNTFVEAFCIGTPLILADSPYSRDLISFNNGVIIEKPITSKKIEETLRKFIANMDEYKNSASKERDVFSYKTIAKQSLLK